MPEYWWGDPTIPIVLIDGALLVGWEGEKYMQVGPEDHRRRLGDAEYVITPEAN